MFGLIALSGPAWGAIGVIGAALVGAAASVFNAIGNRKMRSEVSQINKAVNHVEPGDPTLIQRVVALEANQQVNSAHVDACLGVIADQLGVKLPERAA